MNITILIGRLTSDPQVKLAGDTTVAKFTLAVNRFKKGEADFINCVAFGKTAENIANFFFKGNQIAIKGRIQTGSYEAQDGTRRYTTDVVVESFDFIDSGNNGSKNNSNKNDVFGGAFATPDDSSFDGSYDMTPMDDGDIPF